MGSGVLDNNILFVKLTRSTPAFKRKISCWRPTHGGGGGGGFGTGGGGFGMGGGNDLGLAGGVFGGGRFVGTSFLGVGFFAGAARGYSAKQRSST
jgi:hypothetical protein